MIRRKRKVLKDVEAQALRVYREFSHPTYADNGFCNGAAAQAEVTLKRLGVFPNER